MVGQMLGKPGSLPDVVHQLNLKVSYLDRIKKENSVQKFLQKGETLILHILTCCVTATISSLKSKKQQITVQLSKPVCCTPGQIVAISKNNRRLVGYGEIVGGKQTLPLENQGLSQETVKLITDSSHLVSDQGTVEMAQITVDTDSEEAPTYLNTQELLDNLKEKFKNKKEKIKLNIPQPVFVRDGSKKIRWLNASLIINQLNRSPELMGKFLSDEYSVQTTMNHQNGSMIIRGSFQQKKINKIIWKFCTQEIKCKQCGSLDTRLETQNGSTYQICNRCHSEYCKR
jgi:translation initiation factor 2 beta subunit (eIF-2beta)/eIF-5